MKRNIVVQHLPAFSGREIAISDIHGNLDLYEILLKKISYQPGKDRLILLGDLVEKGTQNLVLLKRIMAQHQEENVFCLMGNCDFTAKNVLYSYRMEYIRSILLARKNSLIHEMAAQIGLPALNEKTDLSAYFATLRKAYLKELSFLNDLPHVIVTPQRYYTHAGLVGEQDFGPDMRYAMTMSFFMNQDVSFSKPVVCGHLPVTEYDRTIANFEPKYSAQKNIYSIDGGNMVKKSGQLNALIFEGNSVFSVGADHLQEAIVCEDVIPFNPSPLFLTWAQGKVDILEKRERQTLVFSKWLSRSFWVENEFLMQKKDGSYMATDYTNYEMPLKKGERVKLVFAYQNKYQIKKNNRLGWTYAKNLRID
jgi:hypothetical protein